jgi:hypothetical protein
LFCEPDSKGHLGLSFFFQSLFYHHHQILLHALSFWRGDLVIKRESAQDEKRKSSYSFSSAFLPPFFSALIEGLAGWWAFSSPSFNLTQKTSQRDEEEEEEEDEEEERVFCVTEEDVEQAIAAAAATPGTTFLPFKR